MEKSEIHKQVEENYARVLQRAQQQGGCCSSAPSGYESLGEHQDLAATSFGCGNPLAFAELEAGQTVLDLGCGAGLDLLLAAERVGASGRVIGVDMSEAMLEAARQHVEGHDNIELRQGLIEQLPLDDASVDWVISNCVINLSPDKLRVFAELTRVLKAGGRLSISDIVAQDLPSWLRDNATLYSACVAGAISEQDYVEGLERAGLDEVRVVERREFSACELVALAQSDLQGLGLSEAPLGELAGQIEGKVWSAKFQAIKRPAGQ